MKMVVSYPKLSNMPCFTVCLIMSKRGGIKFFFKVLSYIIQWGFPVFSSSEYLSQIYLLTITKFPKQPPNAIFPKLFIPGCAQILSLDPPPPPAPPLKTASTLNMKSTWYKAVHCRNTPGKNCSQAAWKMEFDSPLPCNGIAQGLTPHSAVVYNVRF